MISISQTLLGSAGFNLMKYLLTVFVLIIWVEAHSQSIHEVAQTQYEINRTGMLVLGSWALINLGSGIYGNAQFSGQQKYFHQMNAMWNTVNLGLATAGYFSAKSLLTDPTLSSVLSEQMSLENIFLLNTGLDVGYVMAGFFLRERSKNSSNNKNRLAGYGNSLLLQGGFLFVFDLIMYGLHHSNAPSILNLTDQLSLHYIGSGLSISLRL